MKSDKENMPAYCNDVECCALDSGLVDMVVSGENPCGCSNSRLEENDDFGFTGDVSDFCTDDTP